jgi:hypothetical protein
MNTETSSGITVAFHIGRGGRFYNGGLKRYLGEKNIGEIINIYDDTRPMFYRDRDEKGRFCHPYYADHNGNHLIDVKDVESGVGELNFDNDYDTFIAKHIEDCTEHEIDLIRDYEFFKSGVLQDYLNEIE